MKVKIPVIIEDQLTQLRKGMEKSEMITIEDDYMLDGPVSNRVAVLDFDDKGRLKESLKLNANAAGIRANYGNIDPNDVHSDEFIQANVFGIVYRTIEMFEEPDTLGRKVEWAFDSPQLLVIPRAGEWANAFYQRDSCSLQFFYFPSQKKIGQTIYTSLSHDIVAHEAGHAILDGIAPDLYNAITPQSLAMHEAIADLTALVMSFRSEKLRETVLRQTRGSIKNSTAFSAIAIEFGEHAKGGGYFRPLRNLKNDVKLDENSNRLNPHNLSEILTGALYEVMIKIYERWINQRIGETGQSRMSASGYALYVAGEQFKRMIFRALDYLPPGDVSFADYGRAIIAADKVGHKKYEEERIWIAQEFVDRLIVSDIAELTDPQITEEDKKRIDDELESINLEQLLESDWAVYTFVDSCRETLGIPSDISFDISDRKKINRTYYLTEGKIDIAECLLKIKWNKIEENPSIIGLPTKRVVPVGVTLAIDWASKKVLSYLKTDEGEQQKTDRDNMLKTMMEKGVLKFKNEAFQLDNIFPKSDIECIVSNDTVTLKNTAHMLHISHGH